MLVHTPLLLTELRCVCSSYKTTYLLVFAFLEVLRSLGYNHILPYSVDLELIFIVCQEPECISFLFSSDDSFNG
jgi:hypothetical protein